MARQGREISRQWFGRWVDNILDSKVKPQGKAARVGRMTPKVEEFLKAQSVDPGDGAITAVQRLPRLTGESTEVLPNPTNPDRILLINTADDGRILAIAEAKVEKDGVEIVTFFTGAREQRGLVKKARALAAELGFGGTGSD